MLDLVGNLEYRFSRVAARTMVDKIDTFSSDI